MTNRRNAKDTDVEPSESAALELDLDYRKDEIPKYVREIIETHLAIEREDAIAAGALGFMTRSLAIATMPHRNPKTDIFERRNGDFRLRMLAGSSAGLPYGSLPRLLVSWVCREAVKTKNPQIDLGDSLSQFLGELGLSRGGGPRGSSTRVRDQMRRLFGTFISAEYHSRSASQASGAASQRTKAPTGEWDALSNVAGALSVQRPPLRPIERFKLRNIQMVEEADVDVWWNPKDGTNAWQGTLTLTPTFFKECIEGPIPIDTRAYKSLSASPLALDIYTWLTYRMSYLRARSKPILWEALQAQFGSAYGTDDQGLRNFRKAFLREWKKVQILYPKARLEVIDKGVVLLPSPTHVPKPPAQSSFF